LGGGFGKLGKAKQRERDANAAEHDSGHDPQIKERVP
jgi:hypothetical protein